MQIRSILLSLALVLGACHPDGRLAGEHDPRNVAALLDEPVTAITTPIVVSYRTHLPLHVSERSTGRVSVWWDEISKAYRDEIRSTVTARPVGSMVLLSMTREGWSARLGRHDAEDDEQQTRRLLMSRWGRLDGSQTTSAKRR